MADLTSAQRNTINLKMRQTPWYQEYFRARGLNPNNVQLSDPQRKELTQLAATNGMPLPNGGLIDQAGNVNIQHGFAGLPTWAKVAIAAGAAATGFGLAGVGPLGGVLGLGGTTTAAAGSGAAGSALLGGAAGSTGAAAAGSTLPTLAAVYGGAPIVAGGTGATVAGGSAATAPLIAGAAAPASRTLGNALGITSSAPSGGNGFSVSDIVKSAVGPVIAGVTGVYTSRSQSQSADRALQAQLDAQNHAADLTAKSAAEQLQYLKDVEAQRQKEFQQTQAQNYGIYQNERDYERNLFNQRQGRLSPYRTMGANAVAQFGRPISVGSAMGI